MISDEACGLHGREAQDMCNYGRSTRIVLCRGVHEQSKTEAQEEKGKLYEFWCLWIVDSDFGLTILMRPGKDNVG